MFGTLRTLLETNVQLKNNKNKCKWETNGTRVQFIYKLQILKCTVRNVNWTRTFNLQLNKLPMSYRIE